MDPQQRLVLEVSWEALERAGQAPDKLHGSQTGIFIGITTNDYGQLALLANPSQLDAYVATGGALNVAPGRVAYTLGLQGPSVAVDTACSSSLVAIHLACQSLRSGESNLALAGGVNALLRPEAFVCFKSWGMMSPDGHCKTFDARADGFVRGEGCGIIVLKRLSDALANGDNILALIRGSAVNQDGKSSGLTVPNGRAQEAVIRTALKNAGVQPSEISYVEAHGTGTALGDPIEVEALGAALGEGRTNNQPVFLSSVKTNIGHLESAAGIAGVIKAVLAIQHREIPPHLHLEERSPQIPWPAFPVIIPVEPTAWNSKGSRFAGVSAFGFSGTNAHVVLEEAPTPTAVPKEQTSQINIISLSAKNEDSLKQLASRIEQYLSIHPEESLADVSFTLNCGRAHLQHRLAVISDSNEQAIEALRAYGAGQNTSNILVGQVQFASTQKIAFLFTGQGSQYMGMGRPLYEAEPVFRQTMDRCDELLRPYLEKPLLQVLYSDESESYSDLLNQTTYTQPALFALEYSLAELWRSWGIQPSAVMGHSVGEYVAACIAGVFSLEDGLKLIAERGRLMQALPAGGKMAAVFADLAKVSEAVKPYADQVSIAALNGEHVVISGAGTAIDAVVQALTFQSIKCTSLNVSHAFHSPLMEPMLDDFAQVAARISYSASQIQLISNLTGQPIDDEIADAGYWRNHIRATVQFAKSMETLQAQGYQVFVEIGPKPTLLAMGRRALPEFQAKSLWLASLREKQDDHYQILQALGTLYVNGGDVDWIKFYSQNREAHRRLILPTYPFQKERHWFDATQVLRISPTLQGQHQTHPLLGSRLAVANAIRSYYWQNQITLKQLPYLKDHRVQGSAVVPATAYVEMVLAGAAQIFGEEPLILTDIENKKMLFLGQHSAPLIQVVITNLDDQNSTFQVFSQEFNEDVENNWDLHVTGKIRRGEDFSPLSTSGLDIQEIQERCQHQLKGQNFYQKLNAKGNEWGPEFQGIQQLWYDTGEALSIVQVPESLQKNLRSYQFHPAVADACGHVLTATISMEKSNDSKGGAFVGGGIEEIRFYQKPQGTQLWCHARLRPEQGEAKNVLIGDVQVYDQTGSLISETIGARLWYLEGDQQRVSSQDLDNWFYDLEWQALKSTAIDTAHPTGTGTRLIFADQGGIGTALRDSMSKSGNKSVLIFTGETYRQVDQDTFYIRPDCLEDFQKVLKIGLDSQTPNQTYEIVYLWGLDASLPEDKIDIQALNSAQILSVGSVLYIVQELIHAKLHEMPRIWLVTRGSQAAGNDPRPMAVAQSMVWGLGRTIALEHMELWGGLIDLDPQDTSLDNLANHLEFGLRLTRTENQLAIRGGKYYGARLIRKPRVGDQMTPFRCYSNGSYLITGGLGGIGLEVAKWLVSRGARSLILLGRTELPPRREWGSLDPDGSIGNKIKAIRELEAAGAHVHVGSVDIADEKQLGDFVETYRAEGWQPIRGIIHAAGIMQYQPLIEQDLKSMQDILHPKVTGSWLLHQYFKDTSLDFFVMFSSNSALLSSPLMGSYAAANTFMDTLAYHCRALDVPALSINWGTWGEVGMLLDFGGGNCQAGLRGVGTISTQQGLTALERLIQDHSIQAAVMSIDWQKWQESYPIFKEVSLLKQLMSESLYQSSTKVDRHRISLADLTSAGPEEQIVILQSYVTETIVNIMGSSASKLDIQQRFPNMGLDSLMAVELKNRIESDLGINIPITYFLENASVISLSARLHLELGSRGQFSKQDNTVGEGIDAARAQQLLENIDQLSDDEVNSLLNNLMPKEEELMNNDPSINNAPQEKRELLAMLLKKGLLKIKQGVPVMTH